MKKIKVAIAGNPNSGKTSIFNLLTGARQHVGNYPGVTVEKKSGNFSYKNLNIEVVDLPGTYSLTSRSLEERVARDFLIHEKPDVIVDILDASNLERNLYLATQLMDLNIPLVLVLNMSDRAKAMGQVLDIKYFAELTNTLVIETVGSKNIGINELKETVYKMVNEPIQSHCVNYGPEIEPLIENLSCKLNDIHLPSIDIYPKKWLAIKLLEGDLEARTIFKQTASTKELLEETDKRREELSRHVGDDTFTIFAEKRYGFIAGLYHEIVKQTPDEKSQASEKIDSILTNRILGLPIFMGLMYLVFYLTFSIGEIPMEWIEAGFSWLGNLISGFWPAESNSLIKSLIVDGIIGGVGGVLVFLPNILLLFLAIAILEDSGYMSRAAFIIDKLMHKIGLHGKSFIPMLIGFGCSVPGIMATRIIEDRRDRLTTMLVVPLMSCGARLPIYTLIIPAFFPGIWRARMLWIIYMIGIVLAIGLAKLMKSTIFKGKSAPFVMELPPYRMPTIRGLLMHVWERSVLYVKKAGTVILAISIIMWFLMTFPQHKNVTDDIPPSINQAEQVKIDLQGSYAGQIGTALEKVFHPLGFDWKISTALIGAFAAKEVFVAQMGIVYAMEDVNENNSTLRNKLSENYSPLTGFCIMLFCLIATPCMATCAVTRRESGSIKWSLFQFFGLTFIAYIITLIVNQVGLLFF